MKLFTIIMLLTGACFASSLPEGKPSSKPIVTAVRANQQIVVDGILSESIWNNGNGISGFKQRDPVEGADPSESTVVHVIYDDNAIYIGARMFDTAPDSIGKKLARKDNWVTTDMFYFYIDPYHDKRTGFYFAVSAGGTLYDGILYNDSWDDGSWDGVWEGKVHCDSKGWTAELRIPYSQIKFNKSDHYIWGVNFRRDIERKNEKAYLVYTPKKESGFVSRFVDLVGIENIPLPTHTEIIPYITGKAEYLQHDSKDPFNKGRSYLPGMGADLKVGLSSNLTLNATINPDFGQVEVDPAVVNLSDVETYFNEKRPFFVEGSSIFNFGYGGANNYWGFNWPGPNFLYSRRIGRAPQGSIPDNNYSDRPDGTHIIGAAKLTGKVEGNWNLGALTAVTRREYAKYQSNGVNSTVEVEPVTSYSVLRMQRDFNDGKQGIGFMSTHTQRFFKDSRLEDEINKSGTMYGIDGWTFLDSDKEWVFTGYASGSYVTGTKTQITALQENSLHYLQRPDAKSFSVDSNATSLSGYAARFYINKQKGNVFINSAFGVVSPKYDINDLGFMWRTDAINMHVGGGYHWTEPTSWYRYVELGGALFRNYNFDHDITWEGFYHFGYFEFTNYYSINWDYAYNPKTISNRRTRGGPLTVNPPGWQIDASLNSDSRKNWIFNTGFFVYRAGYDDEYNVNFGVTYRPAANISIEVSPQYSRELYSAQWIDAFDDPTATATYGKRYVFGYLDQRTFSAGIRLNWTFTPQLSLQMYMQPLISAGNYSGFKELARPRSFNFNVFGESNNSVISDSTTKYYVDPDGNGPAGQFDFDQPDFNYKSLRGNAVLRWEYQPGSVFYFVWTQSRSDDEDTGDFKFGRSLGRLINTRVNNIFMIKFTYWLNM